MPSILKKVCVFLRKRLKKSKSASMREAGSHDERSFNSQLNTTHYLLPNQKKQDKSAKAEQPKKKLKAEKRERK